MFLRRSFLFQGMDQDFLDAVAEVMSEAVFEEGDLIFRQGDSAEFFYILEEGRIRLSVGQLCSVATLANKQGDVFGWSSLMGNDKYTATVECLAPTRVLRVKGVEIGRVLEEHPLCGLVFFRRVARIIRRRLIDSYRILLTYDPERTPHSYG